MEKTISSKQNKFLDSSPFKSKAHKSRSKIIKSKKNYSDKLFVNKKEIKSIPIAKPFLSSTHTKDNSSNFDIFNDVIENTSILKDANCSNNKLNLSNKQIILSKIPLFERNLITRRSKRRRFH